MQLRILKKTFEAGDLPVPEGKTYAPAFDLTKEPGIQTWLQEYERSLIK